MIGYVTLGTNDLQSSAGFYDAIAKEMGVGRMMDFDTFIAWGAWDGGAGIALTKPYDGKAASVGNGTMVALQAKDSEQVRRLHEIALANGGSDEGAPGPRGEPDAQGNTFYAAYFRDREGNKLNAFCMVRDQ
ncbi:VOC family protein [Pelagerythrobacter aerophilus]|uniref:VOC family protein n=1 Tax=Pelagerythrobacter aerophilus TaxID=2306995 RepID=A0A418NEX0_9SPHN|nr:VOC family protein [Pelagerythrobacter aerophilus]RIV75760.1 VOC family protein [Pelagerythrobacter aerophilus]